MKQFGNIIRYIFIVLLNVVIMLMFHSYLNFLFLILLLLFPIYSLYGVHKVKSKFELKMMTPLEPMKKGENFQIRIILKNPTWYPLLNATLKLEVENTLYREDGDHFLNFPVRAGKETEVVYSLTMDYSGRLRVNTKYIKFVDLLGICELQVDLQDSVECLVLPYGELRNQEAGYIYINGVTEAMESKEKGYDFSDVSGIREYIPGDKLQNIHWKLSVKKNELMVKERVSVSAMQLQVLVELANDDQMRLDAVLDLADSVTKSFVNMNLPFSVYYYSTNMGQLKDCYIGNEIERVQWLEMMLYDQSYRDVGRVEEFFKQQHTGSNSYLYIGYAAKTENLDNAILGDKGTMAELRNRG